MAAFPLLVVIGYHATFLVIGLRALASAHERGYTTEGIILAVVLVLMAIASVFIINAKVVLLSPIIPTE